MSKKYDFLRKGQKVRVVQLAKAIEYMYEPPRFTSSMRKWCGKIMTINSRDSTGYYSVEENSYLWNIKWLLSPDIGMDIE